MVGRFITGIGTGFETSTIPGYQSELCEAAKRGRLVCSEIVFVGLGLVTGQRGSNPGLPVLLLTLVLAAFFDYGMAHINGPLG